MKGIRKIIVGFLGIAALCLVMKGSVLNLQAASVNLDKDLLQVAATEKSVTVQWNTMQGVDKYDSTIKRDVDHYTLQLYAQVKNRNMDQYATPYSWRFEENGSKVYRKIINTPTNYWGKLRVNVTYDLYKMNAQTGEWEFDQTVEENTELHCNAFTKPLRPKANEFGVSDDIESNSLLIKSWIKVNAPRWFFRKEVEIYQGNKRVQKADLSFLDEKRFKLKKGCTYQYRVRYYHDNIMTGDILYSAWSQWKGFTIPKSLAFGSSPGKKGFKLTMSKLPGVSKYTVYTSLKKKTGYKKAQTFKAKNKKKYSVQITKKYKKGKKNYIKIVPYINLKYYKGPSEFAVITPRPLKIYK